MEDDEMKLQQSKKFRSNKASQHASARKIANEAMQHLRMQNSKKPFEIHILVGLPGSGKTTFAHQLCKEHKYYTHYLSEDQFIMFDGIESGIQEFFKLHAYDIARETCGSFACGEMVALDCLMLTNEDVQNVVDIFVNQINKITWDNLCIPAKFIIHQWNEDRTACLSNDGFRLNQNQRSTNAASTIQYAKYEIIDINVLKEMFPDYQFEYVEHVIEQYGTQEQIMHKYENGIITSERWCIGGDRRDCWGSHIVFDEEDDPAEFTEFIDVINEMCPNISHDNYRKLWEACVNEEEDGEPDYYGGCMNYRWYTCDLAHLFEKMNEMGLIEGK